jgi:hypothetical protein
MQPLSNAGSANDDGDALLIPNLPKLGVANFSRFCCHICRPGPRVYNQP